MDKKTILIFKVCAAALWANEKMGKQERDYVGNLIERFAEDEKGKNLLRKLQTQDINLKVLESEIEDLSKDDKQFIFEECFGIITSDKVLDIPDIKFLKDLKKVCGIENRYYRNRIKEARIYKGVKIKRNLKIFVAIGMVIWIAILFLPRSFSKKDFKELLRENIKKESVNINVLSEWDITGRKKLSAGEIYASMRKSVVTVYVKEGDKRVSQGTGSIIGEGENDYYILTNKHVIESRKSKIKEPQNYEIKLYTGARFDARLDFYSRKRDLALLRARIPEEYVGIIKISPKKYQNVGDRVYSLGTPIGMTNTFTEGIISALRDEYIQTDATIFFGNSGGPLINEYAELIGIVTQSFLFKDYSFAIYSDKITDLLKEKEEFKEEEQKEEKEKTKS
ncbi:MAG: serine protease [Candidatus Omnitrophica bacterium]|nr:serine protease [Candidatus Omnitrophota bacterium]MBU1047603.1 serine protease [Candidatus Omnitrophota bacterium]MBU1631489.1 serine protease [Candidatus Omnitrophota bacterium]MBU1888965.1 serine protease [Candidatus Omnitrophota bacterium]